MEEEEGRGPDSVFYVDFIQRNISYISYIILSSLVYIWIFSPSPPYSSHNLTFDSDETSQQSNMAWTVH